MSRRFARAALPLAIASVLGLVWWTSTTLPTDPGGAPELDAHAPEPPPARSAETVTRGREPLLDETPGAREVESGAPESMPPGERVPIDSESDADATASAETDTTNDASEERAAPRWVLRGLVHGPDVVDEGTTSIRVESEAVPDASAVALATPGGWFDVEVTHLLGPHDARRPPRLFVRADHPDFAPGVTAVWASPLRFDEVAPGEHVLMVEVHLDHPYAMLEGRAIGLGEVRVGLFEPGRGRRNSARLADEWTDRGGAFVLRVARRGSYQVVAVAEGGIPTWIDVEIREKGTRRLDPFRVRAGRAVDGHVELPGELDASGAQIVCTPRWLKVSPPTPWDERGRLNWHGVTWDGEGYARRRLEFEVGEGGRFRLTDLEPIEYAVELEGTRGFEPGNPPNGHRMGAAEDVLRLVPEVAIVDYHVYGDEGPLQGAKVALALGATHPRSAVTDAEGVARHVVRAGERGWLLVEKDDFLSYRSPTQTPFAGNLVRARLYLAPDRPGATLALRAGPHERGEGLTIQVSYSDGQPALNLYALLVDGLATFDRLPPGRAEVLVHATPRTLEARFELDLVRGQRVERTLEAPR